MIIFADTFNTYGTNQSLMLDGLYALTFNVALDLDPAGSGMHVLKASTSALTGYLTRRVFPGLRTTTGAGFRLWLEGLPLTTSHIPTFVFLDGSNGQQVAFTVDVIGRIVAHTGGGNLQMAMKSGASTGLGSDRPMTVAFTYWQDVFEVDPATSAQWLPAAVNAANL